MNDIPTDVYILLGLLHTFFQRCKYLVSFCLSSHMPRSNTSNKFTLSDPTSHFTATLWHCGCCEWRMSNPNGYLSATYAKPKWECLKIFISNHMQSSVTLTVSLALGVSRVQNFLPEYPWIITRPGPEYPWNYWLKLQRPYTLNAVIELLPQDHGTRSVQSHG